MSRRHYFGRAAAAAARESAPAVALVDPLINEEARTSHVTPPATLERETLTGPEVAQILGISLATFHARRKSGTFPIREVLPRLDRKPRFYRAHVYAFLRGDLVMVQGRRRA